MEKVDLYISTGEPIGVQVWIPQLTPKAEIVQWGTRLFAWNESFQQYREAMFTMAWSDDELAVLRSKSAMEGQ